MRRVLIVAAMLTMLSGHAAYAAPSGLLLVTNGCGYARVSLPKAAPTDFAVTVERATGFAGVLVYRQNTPGSHFTATLFAPKIDTKPLRIGGLSLTPGRHTFVLCGQGPTRVRVALPGFGRWHAPRLTPLPRNTVTITPVGTAGLETGVGRGRLSEDSQFRVILWSRLKGEGVTGWQMCFTPPGQLCATQSSGFKPTFAAVGDNRIVEGFAAMYAPEPPRDGVIEVYGTRTQDDATRNHLLVASMPTP